MSGIFGQDYIYLDAAYDAKLIEDVNRSEWVSNLNLDEEMRRIKSVPVAGNSPQEV